MRKAWNKGNRKHRGVCPNCGKEWKSVYKRKFCTKECYWESNQHHELVVSNGKKMSGKVKVAYVKERNYKRIYAPWHPYARDGRYVYEHILVMEKIVGRYLDRKNEVVHHINGNGMDNRVSNLEILTRREHSMRHARERNHLRQFISNA